MKRILFVDDEQDVLDGLQNILRKDRKRWDMVFALGGEAALAELARTPFDLIISDMRMPGIDGAELLHRVKQDHPHMARIILSGHAEQEAVLRAIPIAHQYLSKPCDVTVLRAIIERVCGLQHFNEEIRSLVGAVNELPSAPDVYWELMQAMVRPDLSLGHVAHVIEQDPAMCVKILQLVNSAYFGLAQPLTSIGQAVGYLGLEVLKGLVLAVHIFTLMETKAVTHFSLERLQSHSLRTAQLARRFLSATSKDPKLVDAAFTAAIVHDVGKIVLALSLPEQYEKVLTAAKQEQRAVHLVEQELIGTTHAEVGAYLMGLWGLPFNIIEAVAFHHSPGLVGSGHEDSSLNILVAVYVANAWVDAEADSVTGVACKSELDEDFLTRTGYLALLPQWQSIAEQQQP